MNYKNIKKLVKNLANRNFIEASDNLQDVIWGISLPDTISIIAEVGIIPEDIPHDSTEEKLYAKVSDILFAKALKEMNFEVQVLRERSNCADIIAQSKFHGYSLVGDAKSFRLSRTAKNAKDFKVDSMVHWRRDNDYSVLTCPYFQYPKSSSQIYKSALEGNVALFSWEYLYVLLSANIKETEHYNLCVLWNQSAIIRRNITLEDSSKNFIKQQDINIREFLGLPQDKISELFTDLKRIMIERGRNEIRYYKKEINRIQQLDRDSAIGELLSCMKLDSKINTIKNFISQIKDDTTVYKSNI